MKDLSKIIRQRTGQSMGEFCQQSLQVEYKTFYARLKKARLYPAEIVYICHVTDMSVQDLFGADWLQMLVTSQRGSVADKLKDMIHTMTVDQKSHLLGLLGIDPSTPLQASEAAPLPEKVAREKTRVKRAPEQKTAAVSALNSIFIETYKSDES